MGTQKLLVADASEEFCSALEKTIGSGYTFRACHDGVEAAALLDSFQPDILVIDLALSGMDGISVLRSAACRVPRPTLLVTTRIRSDFIESMVSAIGVDYMVMKPCNLDALADRIHDLTGTPRPRPAYLPRPEAHVTNVLLALDVSTKYKGFGCLETAITLFAREPEQSVTKELYPSVAKLHRTTPESVERAIRSAIQAAWLQRDEGVWRQYFHTDRFGAVPRPTNTVFISRLSELARPKSRICGLRRA